MLPEEIHSRLQVEIILEGVVLEPLSLLLLDSEGSDGGSRLGMLTLLLGKKLFQERHGLGCIIHLGAFGAPGITRILLGLCYAIRVVLVAVVLDTKVMEKATRVMENPSKSLIFSFFMEEEVMAKTSLEVEAFRCFLLALVLLFAFDFSILM